MKHPLKFLIYLTIAAIVVFACRDEILHNNSDDTSLKIEEAKTWYELNHNDAVILKSADTATLPVTFYVNWAEVCQRKGKKCETVQVALMSKGKLSVLTAETYQEYKTTKNEKLKRSFTRLVIRSDNKTKKKDAFLITIIPSLDYFKATNYHPFHSAYFDVDENYSGYILYHNLDGTFSNGWKYQDGKKTHTVSQVSGYNLNLKSGYYDCYYEPLYDLVETCTEWHTWSDEGGVINDRITGKTCDSEYVCSGVYQVCTWIENPDDDDSDDDYSGGDVSSGSSSSSDIGTGNNKKALPDDNTLSANYADVANLNAEQVCALIGGMVLYNYTNNPNYRNACALRLSYALNKSGHKIPYTEDQTSSGSDGMYYFYRVTNLVEYLNNTYGQCIETNTDAIQGKTGIIWQSDCGWGDATGHLDVWTGDNAMNHYYHECEIIHFWEN